MITGNGDNGENVKVKKSREMIRLLTRLDFLTFDLAWLDLLLAVENAFIAKLSEY